MKKIRLTNGGFARVDDADYEHLSQFQWYGKVEDNYVHAVRQVTIEGQRYQVRMQRSITQARYNERVRHLNLDTTDNRRSNLETVTFDPATTVLTPAEPNARGVSLDHGGSFRARLKYDGETLNLGSYGNVVEAAEAYDEAAVRLHRDQAVTNL